MRTGRREPAGMARCIALSVLGIFVYRELTNQTLHPRVTDAMNVILLALKVKIYNFTISFVNLISVCNVTSI